MLGAAPLIMHRPLHICNPNQVIMWFNPLWVPLDLRFLVLLIIQRDEGKQNNASI
ncbi:hypothetical protein HHI36_023369 [Cryptolaemus montrouzieri]|uniref:Uncharacterized protein n=1 Tax=Cryptolaemus montrouzieri TaxID=559131 RepID=A0ABD2PGU3_9CUCU